MRKMGFGDPYHEHPLRLQKAPKEGANCVRCELLITGISYGCKRCNHFIHKLCGELPKSMRHPLHSEHLLTLLRPPISKTNNLCNECRNPCLGFAYHCSTCQFFLHLKCFFTLKHEKHEHPLSFSEWVSSGGLIYDCSLCGYPAMEFYFACTSCNFVVHHECLFIPEKVKQHHIHKLNFRYNYPDESDLAYCDVCEDRDGKELDRTLSYYYCKKCDYIAHVRCVARPKQLETVIFEDYAQFPSLMKHPLHYQHTLTFEDEGFFKCTDCEFTLDHHRACWFTHPYHKDYLWFLNSSNIFRCDACGDLGEGFRMHCESCNFDLHLECFALPGKFQHESHPRHPICLSSSQTRVLSIDASTSRYCNVCNKGIDPELWVYCCQECDNAAHLNCVASDMLLTLRSSIKNKSDFCAIVEWDEASFKLEAAESTEYFLYYMSRGSEKPFNSHLPALFVFESRKKFEENGDDGHPRAKCGVTALGLKEVVSEGYDSTITTHQATSILNIDENLADLCHCHKCKLLISTQKNYSSIKDWESNYGNGYEENVITTNINVQTTPRQSDALTLVNEESIDELYCFICNQLIFPPTYSCSSCQMFVHKSCAELPHEYTSRRGHTFTLIQLPSSCSELSSCFRCKYPITGYAYICSTCGAILDVQCALGAPLMKHMNHGHRLFCWRAFGGVEKKCRACKNHIDDGTFYFKCGESSCYSHLHVECALLPPMVKHRIHKHPLELAPNLAALDDEYICDVCEKDLNPKLWGYRCLDTCKGYATSHVTCVVASKKKCHFRYDQECQNLTEYEKLEREARNAEASNSATIEDGIYKDDGNGNDDNATIEDGIYEKLGLRDKLSIQMDKEIDARSVAKRIFIG